MFTRSGPAAFLSSLALLPALATGANAAFAVFGPSSGSPFGAGNQPVSLAVGDLNGDGVPDFAVANFADGTVTVRLGDGSGGFTPGSGSPLAVGDFNRDGIQDLAITNGGAGTITVLSTARLRRGPSLLPWRSGISTGTAFRTSP